MRMCSSLNEGHNKGAALFGDLKSIKDPFACVCYHYRFFRRLARIGAEWGDVVRKVLS